MTTKQRNSAMNKNKLSASLANNFKKRKAKLLNLQMKYKN